MPFRPGQGEKDLFTARFSEGQVGSEQFAGAINANSGGGWGYNGTEFGILLRFGGAIVIQELTVTGAAGGAENATVTIDGTEYTVPLTAGTVQHNASEIADSLTTQVPLWFFEQVDDQVIVTSLISAPATGAFTFSSSTAIAAFVEVAAGVLPTDIWTPQYHDDPEKRWNGEPMPELNPNLINNYKIQFGPSVGFFSVFSTVTNEYVLVHTINENNTSTGVLIENPTFGHSWYALNRAGTSNVTTEGTFAGLYREGKDTITKATDSIHAEVTAGTTEVPMFSLKSRGSINSVINEASAIIKSIQVASDSTKPIIATLTTGGTLTGANWQYIDENNSTLLIDESATAITGGKHISITGFEVINSSELDSELRRGDIFTLSVNVASGGGSSSFSGVITYLEDL